MSARRGIIAGVMDLSSYLTTADILDTFDAGTLSRARDYTDHAVDAWQIFETPQGSLVVYADATGTAPYPYEVTLILDPHSRPRIAVSDCSCPVAVDCKHGAAVALLLLHEISRASEHDEPVWQRSLAALTQELADRDRVVDRHPIALQFGLEKARRHAPQFAPRLTLRPMRPGKKQHWIKSGADWPQIPGLITSGRIVSHQAEAMDALRFALNQHQGFHLAGDATPLESFGPRLPRLLHEAAAAGITFLAAEPVTSVQLAKAPATAIADLTSDTGDGADTVVRVALTVDDQAWHGDGLHLTRDGRVAAYLADDGTLTIAELDRPLTPTLAELARQRPLRIDTDDRDAFDGQLQGLVRHLELRSSDGTVEIPAPVRPVVQLTVTWHTSTDAELTWRWRYGDARCAIDGHDRLDGLRDPVAEAALRESLPPGVLTQSRMRDGDALELALHTLPHLRELDDVEVVESHRPDFREATEAPEVSFDLVEPPEDYTDWLDLEVTVNVEGEAIPLPPVLEALTRDEPYLVLPSGLYVATDRPEFDQLRDAIAAAAELRERDGDRISVGKQDLGMWAQLAETGIVDAQAAEWVARARALRDLDDIPTPAPTGLTTTLRPYQREGFWWLCFLRQHGLGGVLADDMGLGKTLQVLAAVRHAVDEAGPTDDPATGPYLVVAPTSVVTAWQHEAADHVPGLRLGVVSRRSDDVAAVAAASDVVVTTYTLLRLDAEQYAALPWSGLILDEAHQVKNHQSKTYAAARRVEAPFRLAVTGTPFENRLMELWSLLSIAVPGLYPSPKQFRDNVVRPVEKGGDTAALRRLQTRIKPFLLRRTKELVADDLPPKQEQVLDVALHRPHRQLYDTYLAKERQRVLGLVEDFEANRVAIFAALTKLRQLALDPALIDDAHDGIGSAKADVLLDHLAEIVAEGHQALVFSQFTSYLQRVRARLDEDGIATTYLDGSTTDRGRVIEQFRAGEAPVFLISLKAGGVGLTLTEADYVFVLDPWWNPAAEAQAVDRAHRIGQRNRVNVYRLVATDTIEEKVMELKERKAELFSRVIDAEGALGEAISPDDIRALFGEH